MILVLPHRKKIFGRELASFAVKVAGVDILATVKEDVKTKLRQNVESLNTSLNAQRQNNQADERRVPGRTDNAQQRRQRQNEGSGMAVIDMNEFPCTNSKHTSSDACSAQLMALLDKMERTGTFSEALWAHFRRPLTIENLQEDSRNGVPLIVSFLCVRPFRTYECGCTIACQRGMGLGRTLYGYPDFQVADDIISKTHTGHFTFQHASVVTNPDAVMTIPDVFVMNYSWGEGHHFFDSPLSASDLHTQLKGGHGDGKPKSIVVLPCTNPFFGDEVVQSIGNDASLPHPIYLGPSTTSPGDTDKLGRYCSEALGQLDHMTRFALEYTGLEGLNGAEMINDESLQLQYQPPFNTSYDRFNLFTFQELQYCRVKGERRVVHDKGHLPSRMRRQGCRAVYNGNYVSIPRGEVQEPIL